MDVTVNLASAIRANKLKKALNKPFPLSDSPKKFGVYVKTEAGEIVRVDFCNSDYKIRREDIKARKNYRSRHKCDVSPGSRCTSNFWACRVYQPKSSISTISRGSTEEVVHQWDGSTFWDHQSLLKAYPELSKSRIISDEEINPSDEPDDEKDSGLLKAQLNFVIDQANIALANLKSVDPSTLSSADFLTKIALAESSIADLNLIIENPDKTGDICSASLKEGSRVIIIDQNNANYGKDGLISEVNSSSDGIYITFNTNSGEKIVCDSKFLQKL